MTKYVVSHKGCNDGTMSVAVIKRFVKDIVPFFTTYRWQWKEHLDLKKGDSVYFTDICPEIGDLQDLLDKGVNFVVLDHHQSTIDRFDKYWEKEPQKANILRSYCKLKSDGWCGATMVWSFFAGNVRPPKPMPEVLRFIQIADTWDWDKDPNARYVEQYIRSVAKLGCVEDMERLLDEFDYDEAVDKGKLLYNRLMMDVELYAGRGTYLDLNGTKVLTANCMHSVSEVGHALADKSKTKVGATYTLYPQTNSVKFSFRSPDGCDGARKVAETFKGGGGHDQAAGASITMEEFAQILRDNKMIG